MEVSQEAGQVVWYSHLFQNFPQFIVIHTVQGFGIVNKAEIDVFLEFSCFFHDTNMINFTFFFFAFLMWLLEKVKLHIWLSFFLLDTEGLDLHSQI